MQSRTSSRAATAQIIQLRRRPGRGPAPLEMPASFSVRPRGDALAGHGVYDGDTLTCERAEGAAGAGLVVTRNAAGQMFVRCADPGCFEAPTVGERVVGRVLYLTSFYGRPEPEGRVN